jgi:hypothetical protein
LLLAFDFAGTLVFAIEGAMAAENGNLDLLGAMVLAFATALGGGIIRDLLIGASPPNSIRDWRYGAIAFAGAATMFLFPNPVHGIPPSVLVVLDAAGLSLFAVAGAEKALAFGIHPFIAILMGGITGVGGGTRKSLIALRFAMVPPIHTSKIVKNGEMRSAIGDLRGEIRGAVDDLRSDVRAGFDGMNRRLDGLESRFDRLEARFDRMDTEIRKDHEHRITMLEERVFTRLA